MDRFGVSHKWNARRGRTKVELGPICGAVILGVLLGCGGGGSEAESTPPELWAPNFVEVENGQGFATEFCGLPPDTSIASRQLVAGCELTIWPANIQPCVTPAGMITVTGPNDDSGSDVTTWNADDPVRFMSEGGEVPAFDVTVIGPGEVPDLEPAVDWGGYAVPQLPRDQPLAISWTGAENAGYVAAYMTYFDPYDYRARGLRCDFGPTDGTGSVPVEALEQFSRDDPNDVLGTVYVVITAENREAVQVSDEYLVEFRARATTMRFSAAWEEEADGDAGASGAAPVER